MSQVLQRLPVCNTTPIYEDIMPPATGNCRYLPPACLWSRTWVIFASVLLVKTDMASVAGDFCSHIGRVSQAVPAGSSVSHENHAGFTWGDTNIRQVNSKLVQYALSYVLFFAWQKLIIIFCLLKRMKPQGDCNVWTIKWSNVMPPVLWDV